MSKIQLNKKFASAAAVTLIVLLMTSITAYAWFTNKRRLDTITKINAPSVLTIGAGAKEDSASIALGNIDAEDTSRIKDCVFCVYSDSPSQRYKLQLAHTTNINFTYTIYSAEENAAGDVIYVDANGDPHKYKKGTQLSGNYINLDNSNAVTKVADTSLHTESYGDYDVTGVQKNAEPLYWQTSSEIIMENNVDYYILEVRWDENIKGESYNKETDMVYITAGAV